MSPKGTPPDSTESQAVWPSRSEILRFALPSLAGLLIFLLPVPQDGQVTIPLGIISDWLAAAIAPVAPWIISIVITISAVCSLACKFLGDRPLTQNAVVKDFFVTSWYYVIVRCIGAAVAWMCTLVVGPAVVIDAGTGQTMLDLLGTLIAWFFAASFLMPLLMQYGVMEFVGTMLRDFIRPLFRIPGRAAVDLLASWIGNCNVGVVLTSLQYEQGFYTAREAVTIATCFSAVSLPFCLVIAAMLGVDSQFVPFYFILVIVTIVSIFIMCRIPPLATTPDEYYEPVGKQIAEDDASKYPSRLNFAVISACNAAAKAPGARGLIRDGLNMFGGIIFSLTPTVMCYGTIALILATYTPIFTWLSLPFGYYLQLLGVADAFQAAPACILGFADMIIPAVVAAEVPSFATRFIVGILSLCQIIYMTEVGTLILTSKMPIGFFKLLLLFLEKTVIALPLIVALTRLFGITG